MDYLEINRKLWDDKTGIHYKSSFYNVDSFLKGKDSLNPVEIDLLGDIKGKTVLHLQCHFGMDSISLSRHGGIVTGVDFSRKAINVANELRLKLGTETIFIESDIYSLKEKLSEEFDIVFTSYGAIRWLPDIRKWAETIDTFLKPGGILILVEFHPVIWMFSDDFKEVAYNYMDTSPIIEELEGTYTDRNADIKGLSISWNHGLGTVISSLAKSGMKIIDFTEYDYSPYDCFENTVEIDRGKYQIRGLEGKIPMIYSIVAEKPG